MKHLPLNEALMPACILKEQTLKDFVKQAGPISLKYGYLTYGQIEAVLNKVCSGDQTILQGLLRGEKEVRVADSLAKLFDKHGRRIPPRTLTASVTDANRNYFLKHTKLNYAERLARIVDCFVLKEAISADEFENRAEAILEGLRVDEKTQLITNGVHLPFYLPQTQVDDYGRVLDEVFLPAVERSYKAEFLKRSFYNYRKGTLVGQTTIVEGSRHERLVEAMRQGDVVGIYFPNCLQGFSVHADLEQMASLPSKFLLAGGFDAAGAMVAFPDVLARDSKTPLLDLAAMQWKSSAYSLYFGDYDGYLSFDCRRVLDTARDVYAGGLVVLE